MATIFKMLICLLLIALAGIAALLFSALKGMKEENGELRLTEEKLADRIRQLSKERDYKREYFQRLIYDDDFAARVIRQKLGFADSDSIIFRFDESRPVAVDDPRVKQNLQTSPSALTDVERAENAKEKTAVQPARAKSLLDYLTFWNLPKDDDSNVSGSPSAGVADVSNESRKIDAPKPVEIPLIKFSESPAERDKDLARQIDEARADIDQDAKLIDVEKPSKDRISFITNRSGRARQAAKRPPCAITFDAR